MGDSTETQSQETPAQTEQQKPKPEPQAQAQLPLQSQPQKTDADPSWLPERLAQARKTATEAAYRELGGSKDEVQAKLKELEELKLAQMSESERQQKLLESLQPKAQQADRLSALLKGVVDSQFGSLPEQTQQAIDTVAQGDTEKRLELMSVLAAAQSAQPASTQQGASAPKPLPLPVQQLANTAPRGSPPSPVTTRTKWDEFQEISNPTQKAMFYRFHQNEIEKTRPTTPE